MKTFMYLNQPDRSDPLNTGRILQINFYRKYFRIMWTWYGRNIFIKLKNFKVVSCKIDVIGKFSMRQWGIR